MARRKSRDISPVVPEEDDGIDTLARAEPVVPEEEPVPAATARRRNLTREALALSLGEERARQMVGD